MQDKEKSCAEGLWDMNFRTCRYFLTVCEMGTINAAARKLYISQQSLSQHMKRLEEELGVQLFRRENPLVLTPAGECVKKASQMILQTIEEMKQEIAACQEEVGGQLSIGMLDYGTPDFMPALMEAFLVQYPNVQFRTVELDQEDGMPDDIPLLISARDLGSGYKCEVLFTDQLAVCVSDSLLQQQYGAAWKSHKEALQNGDIHALEGCPFVQHWHTPLQDLTKECFRQNHFRPEYLPVTGSIQLATRLCISGKVACTTFIGQSRKEPSMPPAYLLPMHPKDIPAGYISYRSGQELSPLEKRFIDTTREYFSKGLF